jgi:TolB-like protein/tRNA A-37 threonylcarbamoyl transferase component Bud32
MTDLRDQVQQALGTDFEIESELGGGGMSRVYVARDRKLQRRIAVKVLSPELASELSADRFRREIMLSAALQHPHIVGVLDAGETGGLPYFTMPFVDGESLRTRLARGPLTIAHTVGVLKDVARALSYAHARGIVHRDIKPDNVLISGGSACVADFGVAKAVTVALQDQARTGTLTRVGTSIGTPQYMAPEQAAADVVDHRADIYAFGIMAYEMLTGQPPFHGRSAKQLLAAQLTETPAPLDTLRPGVPTALSDLVMRCLQKEADERPQTAAELIETLENPAVVSGDFVSSPGVSGLRMPASVRARRWRRVAIGIASVLALGAIGATIASGRVGARTAGAIGIRSAAPTALVASQVVAVLPLVNLGDDSADARVAEAIADQIANALTRVPGLRVLSSTTVAAAFSKGGGPKDVARALNANTLIEGTVQREGSRLRVTARVVDAADGTMLWADVYDGDEGDVFAIQDHIAEMVRAALAEKSRS